MESDLFFKSQNNNLNSQNENGLKFLILLLKNKEKDIDKPWYVILPINPLPNQVLMVSGSGSGGPAWLGAAELPPPLPMSHEHAMSQTN